MSDRTVGIGSTVSFGFMRARRGLVAAASIPAGVMASPAVAQTQQQIEWCENTSRAFSPDRQIDGCTAAIRSGDQRSQKELASYFNSRGLAYRTKGDFDRAIADFDEAIRLEPKNALLFNARGVAYSAKRDYGRAMADFDEAIRLEPKGAAAFLNNRGLARHSMNDYDGAIADFDEVIRLTPNYALAYITLAAMPTATRATAAVPIPTTPRPTSWASNLMLPWLAR